MPQKRNPYALVVLRGGAGTLIGRATGVLATQRTPSGPHRQPALRLRRGRRRGRAGRAHCCASPPRSPRALTVDRERGGARRAREPRAGDRRRRGDQPAATGLDYRSAYSVVGRAVAEHGTLDATRSTRRRELLGRRSTSTPVHWPTRSTRRARSRRAPCPAAPRRRRWTRCSRDCRDARDARSGSTRAARRRARSGDRAPPSASAASASRRPAAAAGRACRSAGRGAASPARSRPRRDVAEVDVRADRRSSHACCARCGASKMTVSCADRVQDRVDELAVHGAGGVEEADASRSRGPRRSPARRPPRGRRASPRTSRSATASGAPLLPTSAITVNSPASWAISSRLARAAPSAASRWRPRRGRSRARAATRR